MAGNKSNNCAKISKCPFIIDTGATLKLCITCEQNVNCMMFTRLHTDKSKVGRQVLLFPKPLGMEQPE